MILFSNSFPLIHPENKYFTSPHSFFRFNFACWSRFFPHQIYFRSNKPISCQHLVSFFLLFSLNENVHSDSLVFHSPVVPLYLSRKRDGSSLSGYSGTRCEWKWNEQFFTLEIMTLTGLGYAIYIITVQLETGKDNFEQLVFEPKKRLILT